MPTVQDAKNRRDLALQKWRHELRLFQRLQPGSPEWEEQGRAVDQARARYEKVTAEYLDILTRGATALSVPFKPGSRKAKYPSGRKSASSAVSASRTILVLDDDRSSRFVLREMLEGDGHTVLESANAEGVIFLCKDQRRPIDLIIADVVLRAPDGSKVVRRIRELRPDVPLLFISGYALEDEELINSALLSAWRRTSFLQKPFTPEALRGAVVKLLS